MSRYLVKPAGLRDIEEIAAHIGQDSPDSARRFIIRCHETFAWLAEMPRVGRPRRPLTARTRGVRVWRVAGFPNYFVFYRIQRRQVLILHVLSGSRDLDHFDI